MFLHDRSKLNWQSFAIFPVYTLNGDCHRKADFHQTAIQINVRRFNSKLFVSGY